MEEKYMEERFKNVDEKLENHSGRLTKLEDTYSMLEKMDYRVGNIEASVKNINLKLDSNQTEKGKKWDKLWDYLFYTVLGLLLSYIAFNIGLK